MGLGPHFYVAWFVLLLASVVIAALHLIRKRALGMGPALAAVAGAFMTWALVSAYIGVCELDSYATTKAFAVSLAIGAIGVGLIVFSCVRLRRKCAEPDPGDRKPFLSSPLAALFLAGLGVLAILLFLWFAVDALNILSMHP